MQPFSQSQQEFLGRLLEVIIRKMKYDDETDWGNEEEEPEEEALFVELRKVKKKKKKLIKSGRKKEEIEL